MSHDLKITNGLVYDGDGGPPRRVEIGVRDGRIAEIAPKVGAADRTLDAQGGVVAPGFVDPHTHYDGQASWDDALQPSVNHGVTTAVMGNCGVGFAPCRPADRERLIRLMEGVEDIPGSALAEGLTWEWETFPEYLDALDAKPRAIDIAAQVPHDPIRVYVMGERALAEEAATPDDIAAMRALTRQALDAGAVGFSTGRSDVHKTADGDWTPASEASRAELTGLAGAFKGLGRGVVQAVSDFDLERDAARFDAEFDVLEAYAAASGLPFSLSLMQRDFAPDQWRKIIARAEAMEAKGLPTRLQVAPRAIGVFLGLTCTFHPFMGFPSYRAIADLPLAARVAAMRDPAFRARLLSEKSQKLSGPGSSVPPIADMLIEHIDFAAMKFFELGDPPDYEQPAQNAIGARAAASGQTVWEALYDAVLGADGRALIYLPIYNYTDFNYDNVHAMMTHPQALMGLSDGGAHVGTICDASFPTYLMSYWTGARARGDLMAVTDAIAKLTAQPADYFGFSDRGRLREGLRADINVIDLETLSLTPPRMVADLPAGGQRLLQDARGYRATFVAGAQVIANDALTGERPGRLVRGGQARAGARS